MIDTLFFCPDASEIVKNKNLPTKYQCLAGCIAYVDNNILIVPISNWEIKKFPIKMTSLLFQNKDITKILLLNPLLHNVKEEVGLVQICIDEKNNSRKFLGNTPENVEILTEITDNLGFRFYQTAKYIKPEAMSFNFMAASPDWFNNYNKITEIISTK